MTKAALSISEYRCESGVESRITSRVVDKLARQELRLSEEMSGIFARITGEKYTRIHLGAGLEPVISRGDAVPISPENLSQGAQDQLYFAMRIAMARHLSRNIRVPLFLDDPFVNFDEERLRVTKDVLDNLDGHQVVMVTCNRDYEDWSDSVLDLDKARSAA